jgi:hypothetical protein
MTSKWNISGSSSLRSDSAEDASNRIFDGYAEVRPQPTFKITQKDPIYGMGSCFAREMESALIKGGGNIVSIDETIRVPAFSGVFVYAAPNPRTLGKQDHPRARPMRRSRQVPLERQDQNRTTYEGL